MMNLTFSQASYLKNAPEKFHIVTVDDSIENLFLLNEILKIHGFQVEGFSNPYEAITIIQRNGMTPDMVITETSMSDGGGFNLLKAMQRNPLTCHIPIVFCSSLDDRKIIDSAFKLGAVDYIIKPYDIDRFITRINNHLLHGVNHERPYTNN